MQQLSLQPGPGIEKGGESEGQKPRFKVSFRAYLRALGHVTSALSRRISMIVLASGNCEGQMRDHKVVCNSYDPVSYDSSGHLKGPKGQQSQHSPAQMFSSSNL